MTSGKMCVVFQLDRCLPFLRIFTCGPPFDHVMSESLDSPQASTAYAPAYHRSVLLVLSVFCSCIAHTFSKGMHYSCCTEDNGIIYQVLSVVLHLCTHAGLNRTAVILLDLVLIVCLCPLWKRDRDSHLSRSSSLSRTPAGAAVLLLG